jgi:prophage antirepressor-like protein
MNDLVLVKSEMFGTNQVDFYKDDQTQIVMTAEQLGMALEYSTPRESINKLVSRNEYLRQPEFSTEVKMTSIEGGREVERSNRVFTEDGIYEVTMLAKTEKAKEFRAWVRKILKALRKGEAMLIQPTANQIKLAEIKRQELEVKAKNAEARLKNATVRQANFLLKEIDKHKGVLSVQSVELLTINALEMIVGKNAIPRPQLPTAGKYYTATEIAKEAGVSSMKIGQYANAHNLKTDENGMYVLDKSPHSDKQVQNFRYNELGRQRLLALLQAASCHGNG